LGLLMLCALLIFFPLFYFFSCVKKLVTKKELLPDPDILQAQIQLLV
jgi:hypothetical protein